MSNIVELTSQTQKILNDIFEHQDDSSYWEECFNSFDSKEDAITRSCFEELRQVGFIDVRWADNYPYHISILGPAYIYHDEYLNRSSKSEFERQMQDLLDRTKTIKRPINAATFGTNIDEYNKPSEIWVNDFELFYRRFLSDHPFADRIESILYKRNLYAYKDLVNILESIYNDKCLIEKYENSDGVKEDKSKKLKFHISKNAIYKVCMAAFICILTAILYYHFDSKWIAAGGLAVAVTVCLFSPRK